MPELENAFKTLGNMIVSVGMLVAKQCDKYVHSICPSYEINKLQSILEESRCCKARLLHYYPNKNLIMSKDNEINDMKIEKENIPIIDCFDNNSNCMMNISKSNFCIPDEEFSSWCGWHNDHGSLTGLTSALLLNEEGEIIETSDPTSGITSSLSELSLIFIKVSFYHNCNSYCRYHYYY